MALNIQSVTKVMPLGFKGLHDADDLMSMNDWLYFAVAALLHSAMSSVETSGSLECEHPLPRLPYSTAARTFRDSCFQFVAVEKYWPEARQYCHRVGITIVSV